MDKYINYESEEVKELEGQIEQAFDNIADVRDKHRPTLADEHYLSGEEVMKYLHNFAPNAPNFERQADNLLYDHWRKDTLSRKRTSRGIA